MRLADDAPKTADEVIDRFNRAFQEAAGYSKTAPTVAALES